MKSLFKLYMAGLLLITMSACEKDLSSYDSEETWLNFVYYSNGERVLISSIVTDAMSQSSYSFALQSIIKDEELQQDTVWVEVETMGFLSDENRTVEFQQMDTDGNDAVPGRHYVAFDDPSLLSKSFVPANQSRALIPVVVLRDNSQEAEDVTLKFTIKDNGYFKPGYTAFSTITLTISTQLSKPANWDLLYMDYSFGTYTSTKHELMIEWTGNLWDDEYLTELYANSDYMDYLSQWFQIKLEEENQKRLEQGLDVYREPNGEEVSFAPASWW